MSHATVPLAPARCHAGHFCYDELQIRRAGVMAPLASTLTGVKYGGRTHRLAPLREIPDAALRMRFLAFSPELRLLGATDEPGSLVRLAAAHPGSVLVAELPKFAAEAAQSR
jgi:hypothetical protein